MMKARFCQWLAIATVFISAQVGAEAPRLVKHGSATQLSVQGKPMLLIAGELGNSSASSAAYMAPHWAKLKAMHLNTVLAPVSWELIEPQEGRYDWSSVDALLRDARANDLKLVVLWFGAWKNSMSTYVPAWVKRDQDRFPRAELPNGQGVEILSAFAPETLKADQRAFVALMAHLKKIDGAQRTVLMVQVENEVGTYGLVRDFGAKAQAAFERPVPAAVLARQPSPVRRAATGSWREVYGDYADEYFHAWAIASYIEQIAQAGRAV